MLDHVESRRLKMLTSGFPQDSILNPTRCSEKSISASWSIISRWDSPPGPIPTQNLLFSQFSEQAIIKVFRKTSKSFPSSHLHMSITSDNMSHGDSQPDEDVAPPVPSVRSNHSAVPTPIRSQVRDLFRIGLMSLYHLQ